MRIYLRGTRVARRRSVSEGKTPSERVKDSETHESAEARHGGLVRRRGNEHGGFDSVEIVSSCEECGNLKDTLKELNVKVVEKPYFERNRVLLMDRSVDEVAEESGCVECDKAEKKP